MNLPGVPESITRTEYLSLIEATGLDLKDVRKLEFRVHGIYAEVFVRNANGRMQIDDVTDEPFVHRVFIPVVEI